jgi:hypothetical protein
MLELSDGLYPFVDERFPLSELVMVEAPVQLEALFKAQAAANGVEIMRDQPVELNCRSDEYPDATFLIYWPLGQPRLHMLVPKRFAQGRVTNFAPSTAIFVPLLFFHAECDIV